MAPKNNCYKRLFHQIRIAEYQLLIDFKGMERNIIICSLVRSNKIAESETSMEETFVDNKGDFS